MDIIKDDGALCKSKIIVKEITAKKKNTNTKKTTSTTTTTTTTNEQQEDTQLETIIHHINQHPFNQSVHVVVPVQPDASSSASSTTTSKATLLSSMSKSKSKLEDTIATHFLQRATSSSSSSSSSSSTNDLLVQIQVSLHQLINYQFVTNCIVKGEFIGLSQLSGLDSGNVVAFLANGTVVLNVNKETYEVLGLTGKHSAFNKGQRFIITINLMEKKYSTEDGYKRLNWCFNQRIGDINLLCRMSTNAFERLKSLPHKVLANDIDFSFDSIHLPLDIKDVTQIIDKQEQQELVMALNEVIGTCICGVVTPFNVDFVLAGQKKKSKDNGSSESQFDSYSFISSPEIDNNNNNNNNNNSVSHSSQTFISFKKGMILPSEIVPLAKECRQLVATGSAPWAAVHVSGFADSPISWGLNEHAYGLSGENDYTLVFQKNNKCCLHFILNSSDTFS
ncbi:RNase P protein subunit [Cavenderia fasciculata]|uniref:RNase P protein subunit n=1 Tax=Cavenderia fasciculata TaxID=261658 RepID=F4PSR8_CACFS|nr:RNase P protein subunit [Cavenderia fasciculata]EGG21546.1 RNase P protein subunit [Cavenderia fasciculata]|eukprot:XP_004359396.1 RNase P protein subunit [Cavenderia fasciculata]